MCRAVACTVQMGRLNAPSEFKVTLVALLNMGYVIVFEKIHHGSYDDAILPFCESSCGISEISVLQFSVLVGGTPLTVLKEASRMQAHAVYETSTCPRGS